MAEVSPTPPFPIDQPGKDEKGRESSAKTIAVLFSGKSLVQRELEEFPFFPAFSLTAPQGHHILYA